MQQRFFPVERTILPDYKDIVQWIYILERFLKECINQISLDELKVISKLQSFKCLKENPDIEEASVLEEFFFDASELTNITKKELIKRSADLTFKIK